jgi:hypothetical protein
VRAGLRYPASRPPMEEPVTDQAARSATDRQGHPENARPGHGHSKEVADRVLWYRGQMGWDVGRDAGGPRLWLGEGIVAVLAPREQVAGIWGAYRRMDLPGPILLTLGERSTLVLLADSNDLVLAQDELPPSVHLLRAPSSVPLPLAGDGDDRCRWLLPPHPSRRWLPSAEAVVCAVQLACAPRLATAHPRSRPQQAGRRRTLHTPQVTPAQLGKFRAAS